MVKRSPSRWEKSWRRKKKKLEVKVINRIIPRKAFLTGGVWLLLGTVLSLVLHRLVIGIYEVTLFLLFTFLSHLGCVGCS